jgi:hypothetical protein
MVVGIHAIKIKLNIINKRNFFLFSAMNMGVPDLGTESAEVPVDCFLSNFQNITPRNFKFFLTKN